MNWAVEWDDQGQPVRMHWFGNDPRPEKEPPLNEMKCPLCGLPNGWHYPYCWMLNRAAPTVDGGK